MGRRPGNRGAIFAVRNSWTRFLKLFEDYVVVQGSGKNLMVTDEKGGMAHVTIVDVYQSNGVIQVVDRVLLPN